MVVQEEQHQRVAINHESRADAIGFSVKAQHNLTRTRTMVTHIYCGRMGHPVRDCYQLHGFPETRNEVSGRGK